MDKARDFKITMILIILSFIFLMCGNGILSLTNPDEVFYAQTAKEMIQENSWTTPYLFGQPQFEKPILTYWLLRIWFMLWGISNFGARFFPALFAMIGVLAVYLLALCGYHDREKSFVSALVLASSGLYIGLARTLFTDMIFSVFIVLSLVSFFWGYTREDKKAAGIICFFVFSALAVLTKGPLGFLIPVLVVLLFLGFERNLRFLWCAHTAGGLLIFLVIAVPWYLFMIRKFGNDFIQEFFYNDHIRRILEAEHEANDRWYFYPLSMLLCMFPWSVFVGISLFYLGRRLRQKSNPPIYLFLFCWVLVTLGIFQCAHSKLVSYILPVFPALALITGDYMYRAMRAHGRQIFISFLIAWCVLLLIPVGLIISSAKYPEYVSSKEPLYDFIILYVALLVLIVWCIVKRKWLATMGLFALQLPLLLVFVLSSHASFDAFVSSRSVCEYMVKNHMARDTLLCSKFFVRGVRFFTDTEVAVVNIGGSNFFSPHPIPYLDTDEKVKVFLQTRPITYCVLSKASVDDIRRIVNTSGLRAEVLKIIGDEHIVRVTSR